MGVTRFFLSESEETKKVTNGNKEKEFERQGLLTATEILEKENIKLRNSTKSRYETAMPEHENMKM